MDPESLNILQEAKEYNAVVYATYDSTLAKILTRAEDLGYTVEVRRGIYCVMDPDRTEIHVLDPVFHHIKTPYAQQKIERLERSLNQYEKQVH